MTIWTLFAEQMLLCRPPDVASSTLCNPYLNAADLIHPWTVGAYWALPISYVQNAMAINEFTGGECCAGSQCTVVLGRAAPLVTGSHGSLLPDSSNKSHRKHRATASTSSACAFHNLQLLTAESCRVAALREGSMQLQSSETDQDWLLQHHKRTTWCLQNGGRSQTLPCPSRHLAAPS